ncbi:MAG: Lrp/AsnC family transcriptional regulator [Candidatus Bathyarchaeia archaeon]
MDELDSRILALLKEDSRASFTKIGRTLGLSEGAVRQRVRRLVDSGIIRKFTIELGSESPRAIVFVSTSPNIPSSRVAEKIAKIARVVSVVEVAGPYDISALISGDDIRSVNEAIDAIREVEGVQTTNTLFVLRSWK